MHSLKKILSSLYMIFLCCTACCTSAYAAYEDFTTFSESDPWGDITVVNATTSNIVSMTNKSPDCSLYKDCGSGYFGTGTINIAVKHTSNAGSYARAGFLGLHNISTNSGRATMYDMDVANAGLSVNIFEDANPYDTIRMQNYADDDYDYSTGDLTIDTFYYVSLVRDATTTKVHIYTDSDRTNLYDTLSVTHDSTEYQYIVANHSKDVDDAWGNGTYSGVISNLEFLLDSDEVGQIIMIMGQ